MAWCICSSKSSTTCNCWYDSDSISFYLFAEEGAEVTMVTYQIHLATKQFFQILGGRYVVHHLGRHRHKDVNIAPFVMFVSCHRTKQPHGSDAKA